MKKARSFDTRLFCILGLDRRLPPVAHWEPLAGHPAPHHLEETTMTSTDIAPSSPDYYSGETSTLKILEHPSGAGLYVPLGQAYSKCELFTPAQPEVSQNRPADVDAAQAAFEATLMAINTRTSTPYVDGTFAFDV